MSDNDMPDDLRTVHAGEPFDRGLVETQLREAGVGQPGEVITAALVNQAREILRERWRRDHSA